MSAFTQRPGSFRRYLPWMVLAAIAALLLFSSHRWHVLGYLPLLFLLACPLLHFGMHGGHSGHGGRSGHGGHKSAAGEAGEAPTGRPQE